MKARVEKEKVAKAEKTAEAEKAAAVVMVMETKMEKAQITKSTSKVYCMRFTKSNNSSENS